MGRIHIKGGSIISMDPAIKDLPRGDVLVEDGNIAAVAPWLSAGGAEMIDAAGMIVLPGLINAHVHTWQSALRGIAGDWTVPKYMQAMHGGLASYYRPEDIRCRRYTNFAGRAVADMHYCTASVPFRG